MGPPELAIILMLAILFAVPIAVVVGIYKLVAGGGNDERIAELEQRVDELEDETS